MRGLKGTTLIRRCGNTVLADANSGGLTLYVKGHEAGSDTMGPEDEVRLFLAVCKENQAANRCSKEERESHIGILDVRTWRC